MAETSLGSLSEDMGLGTWPIEGDMETPSKYTHLSFDALCAHPAFAVRPELLGQLVEVLRQTLAFDDPFGDMVIQTEEAEALDNEILKTMEKLGIPPNFPLSLAHLSPETADLCKREELTTLEQLASFAQKMAQQIVIGGDFRDFINSLANVDETGIARFIPFRPGSKGLHLIEATALLIRHLPEPFCYSLCQRYGAVLNAEQKVEAGRAVRQQIAEYDAKVRDAVMERLMWFNGEESEIRDQLAKGISLDRTLMVLNDPVLEAGTRGILTQLYGKSGSAVSEVGEKGGWLRRIFRRGPSVRS
ncbi:MAG: hypothetical protein R3F07_20430 [Opitutaceae bacterium]